MEVEKSHKQASSAAGWQKVEEHLFGKLSSKIRDQIKSQMCWKHEKRTVNEVVMIKKTKSLWPANNESSRWAPCDRVMSTTRLRDARKERL